VIEVQLRSQPASRRALAPHAVVCEHRRLFMLVVFSPQRIVPIGRALREVSANHDLA
jgi:hypothetical protein